MRAHAALAVLAAIAGPALAWPCAAFAQPPAMRLEDALRRADRNAYANRIADGQADARAADVLATWRGVLPALRVEAGWMRTTDPIGAFGTTLRQRVITQADFDPAGLNHPAPIGNYSGALIVEQPLFNADAHVGRRAASRAASAAAAEAEWTRSATRLAVVRAWYGAVLAADRVATLEAAARAAAGHVRQAENLVGAGMATRSDALLASVKAGEVDADLAEARGAAELARRGLAVLLGLPADSAFVLPAKLPDPESVRRLAGARPDEASVGRSDVTAARLGHEAAAADVTRARSLHLPRVNAFARLEWNSAARPYAGEENWTAGVMLSWAPFTGGSELAELRGAAGRERAARAGAEAAAAQAALEVERATVMHGVALERLEIAVRAVSQSVEAHRIVARKYEGGLATVVELLDAAAIETQTGLALSAAVHRAIVAEAERRHASGLDVTDLTILGNEAGADR
jgi:outer membrane protein